MEQRHARKGDEIKVEMVSMCTVRLGEDKASEEGPLGVKKQGDGPCLYNLAREQDDGLGSYHFTKDRVKWTRRPLENQWYVNMLSFPLCIAV